MYYAKTIEGKLAATPGMAGTCPMCGGIVIPKCGEINAWHWAHKSNGLAECDSWSEGETDWHLQWKSYFPPDITEVTETKDGVKHRADVKLSTGWVLEFQNSPISPEAIRERNEFWGKVIWVINVGKIDPYRFDWNRVYENESAQDMINRVLKKHKFEVHPGGSYDTFEWRHAKRTLEGMENFVLDFGITTFLVKKIYFDNSPTRGWGYHRNKFQFINDTLKVIDEWKKVGITKTFDWRTLKFSEPVL